MLQLRESASGSGEANVSHHTLEPSFLRNISSRRSLILQRKTSVKRKTPILFDEQEEIDAEKRALRVLLDSFHVEDETELAKALEDHFIQRNIVKFIATRAVPADKRKN